jgi:hypothetical protein
MRCLSCTDTQFECEENKMVSVLVFAGLLIIGIIWCVANGLEFVFSHIGQIFAVFAVFILLIIFIEMLT